MDGNKNQRGNKMQTATTHNGLRTKTAIKYNWDASDKQNAEVKPGKNGAAFIRLFGEKLRHNQGSPFMQPYDRTFKIGSPAEYDSYNIHYIGRIVAIGPKTVTIEAHGRKRRLDLASFSDRNWDGIDRKVEHNQNWTD
jgi:hypothetical protein